RHWEAARKVNARGEKVALAPGGSLADAAWAGQLLSRATLALPSGYCGLPAVRSCPHANACFSELTVRRLLGARHERRADREVCILRYVAVRLAVAEVRARGTALLVVEASRGGAERPQPRLSMRKLSLSRIRAGFFFREEFAVVPIPVKCLASNM